MLFLVISTPRAEPSSDVSVRRQGFWRWLAPLQDNGLCKWGYARAGRGAVAVFDADSHETLHRLLNEWTDIIPATFQTYPLIDIDDARAFLDGQA